MKYLIYQITNIKNGKIYIGAHKTELLNDDYMGSGTYLQRAIKKHGIDAFEKTILIECDTEEEMFNKEAEIVNEEFVSRSDTYNLRLGGIGGFTNEAAKKGSKRMRELGMHLVGARKHQQLLENEEYKAKWISNITKNHPRLPHSEETKRKIGKKNSKKQKGRGNSQYGTVWITNGNENKKMKKTDAIPKGWYRGRILG